MHGFFRHADESLGFQRVVKGLVHDKKNVSPRGRGILIFGLRAVFGAGKQIGGAAEIGNKLCYGRAARGPREKGRSVEKTGGDAASRVGIHGCEAEIGIRH